VIFEKCGKQEEIEKQTRSGNVTPPAQSHPVNGDVPVVEEKK
jgi:hypothetical protein